MNALNIFLLISSILGFIASTIGILNFLTEKKSVNDYLKFVSFKSRKLYEIKPETIHLDEFETNRICRIFKKENTIYFILWLIVFLLFIVNLLFYFIPYYESQDTSFRNMGDINTVSLFLFSLLILPLLIIKITTLWLSYFVFRRIITKRKEYNTLIYRFIAYYVYGIITILLFFFLLEYSNYNGKFDFWLYPKDEGYGLILFILLINIYVRKRIINLILLYDFSFSFCFLYQ